MKTKTLHLGSLQLKADSDETGAFRATFARFNVKDLDGDVTKPGAFAVGAPVRIAQWGHNWGVPAIGTGKLGADSSRAWVDGRFNLNMAAGRETYEAVKALGDLQQWSYGFDIDKWSTGTFEGQQVRFLERMKVHEVSPVMLGAQPLTNTDSIKARRGSPLVSVSKHPGVASVQIALLALESDIPLPPTDAELKAQISRMQLWSVLH